jgi:hypothetical protein
MPTMPITAPRSSSVPAAVRAAQVLLLGPLGALVVFGSIYFSVIAPPQDVAGVDWLVGAWALALGTGNLVVGSRLAGGRPGLRRAALALVASHLAFGLVKIVGYGETEAATFMVLDALTLGLLTTGAARRFDDTAGRRAGSLVE